MKRIKPDRISAFLQSAFEAKGMTPSDAAHCADVLIEADLRGIDSHGLSRLSGYIRLIDLGRINVAPKMKIVSERLSAATLDADGSIGLLSATHAIDLAIEKAEKTGIGVVAVKNSNHFGIAAYHAERAVAKNMIGISMTNASPLVAPTFSKERMLGTNPMCFAFPVKSREPLVFDMATSTAANGKLQLAERKGEHIPSVWAVDEEGHKSDDPKILKKGGSLLPLGSTEEGSSHKGYGFSAVVDVLSGVLSGANFGPWVPPFVAFLDPPSDPVGEGMGHFLAAFNIEAFRPMEDYFRSISQWIDRFKNAEAIDPEIPVLVHGELEQAERNRRLEAGIPMEAKVLDDLNQIADNLAIKKL